MYSPSAQFMDSPSSENNGKIDKSPIIMQDVRVDHVHNPASNGFGKLTCQALQEKLFASSLPVSQAFHKPLRPKTAFEVFVQYENSLLHEKLRKEGRELAPNDPAILNILKEQWKGMVEWQKNVYKKLAEVDRKRYKNELIQWNACNRPKQGQVGEYLRSVLVKPVVQNPRFSGIPPLGSYKRKVSFEDSKSSRKVARFSNDTTAALEFSDWDDMVNSQTSLIGDDVFWPTPV